MKTAAGDNAENPNIGDLNGISMPAILNEVVSVTGPIPFPYSFDAVSLSTDPRSGSTRSPSAQRSCSSSSINLGRNDPTFAGPGDPGRRQHHVLQRPGPRRGEPQRHHRLRRPGDRHPHVPTQVRPVVGQTAADLGTIDAASNIVYDQGGTSMSAGIVTGSFPW